MMKVNLQEKKENLFLKRTEVQGRLEEVEAVTPSNAQLAEILAKELNKEVGLVVIKKINHLLGKRTAKFSAVVYQNLEAKTKVEPKKKEKKAAAGEQKKEEK